MNPLWTHERLEARAKEIVYERMITHSLGYVAGLTLAAREAIDEYEAALTAKDAELTTVQELSTLMINTLSDMLKTANAEIKRLSSDAP